LVWAFLLDLYLGRYFSNMWEKITQIAKTASAMLHSGEVPPNTPPEYRQDLSRVNFLASKKFYVVFCSVIILSIFYAASIFVLFLTAAQPSLTVPFVSLFTETIKILAVIIASYLGVQTVLDYKMQSNSNVDLQGQNSFIKEEITYINSNAKEEDYELK
jgi:hypothetical protein